MKKRFTRGLLTILSILVFSALYSGGAAALDKFDYEDLVHETIAELVHGSPDDVDALIKKQDMLMKMGASACRKYSIRAKEHAEALEAVIEGLDRMKASGIEELEYTWHEREFLAGSEVDYGSLDHYSEVFNYMDIVIHPAKARAALVLYKESGDPEYLNIARGELMDAIDHLDRI